MQEIEKQIPQTGSAFLHTIGLEYSSILMPAHVGRFVGAILLYKIFFFKTILQGMTVVH